MCLVPPVPLVGILRSLQQVLCCTNCQNKQKQYNCLLIHPRDTGDWLSCKSSFYCSTLERMLGGTLVSGETFIGAQSIASFSRSPLEIFFSRSPLEISFSRSLPLKYPIAPKDLSCSRPIINWLKISQRKSFRCNCIFHTYSSESLLSWSVIDFHSALLPLVYGGNMDNMMPYIF